MNQSIYKIAKMDRPSDAQWIKIKLKGIKQIRELNFDIPNRKLVVIHSGWTKHLTDKINSLNLEGSLVETKKAIENTLQTNNIQQRKLFWDINFTSLKIKVLKLFFK